MLEYKGYLIIERNDHVMVITSTGDAWTEDTVRDAKESIDNELDK